MIALTNVGDNTPCKVSRVMRINPDGTHSLSNKANYPNLEKKISVFPNPARRQIFINWPSNTPNLRLRVRIFDRTGTEIYNKEVKSSEPIDLSSFKGGLYAVSLQSNGITHSEKLLILN